MNNRIANIVGLLQNKKPIAQVFKITDAVNELAFILPGNTAILVFADKTAVEFKSTRSSIPELVMETYLKRGETWQ